MPLLKTVSPAFNSLTLAQAMYAADPVMSRSNRCYMNWSDLKEDHQRGLIDEAQAVIDILVGQKLLGTE